MKTAPLPNPLSRIAGGGTYVLWLHLAEFRLATVGRLGAIAFAAGFYGYVGSAQGPGGLAARVGRHLRGGCHLRWHIDYLRLISAPVAAWLCISPHRHEHDWAAALAAMPGTRLPVPRFGTGDCRCPAHLVCREHLPPPERIIKV